MTRHDDDDGDDRLFHDGDDDNDDARFHYMFMIITILT